MTEPARVETPAAVAAACEEIAAQRRIPCATYRLQFNRGFTFRDALSIVPYLHDLGITDCYASPLFKTRADSRHGYDICDHSQLSPDLGGQEDFDAFVAALRERGMGLMLDMVPNHMGIGDANNLWWMDVLENGPSSPYASYFDIDWQPAALELESKVLLPILEDQYGRVLVNGKLRLTYEDGAFFVYYYQTKLPVAPRTYSSILGYRLESLIERLGEDDEQVHELQSILTALSYLPLRTELDPERIAERTREKEVIKRRIAALYDASPDVRGAIGAAVQAFNGMEGNAESFDLLDALLDEQAYRLAFWRVAADEINYRRFFDINDLAAIRAEVPEVFEATHEFVLRLLAEGKVTGLRIDHADGLWDPAAYLRQLQEAHLLQQVRARLGHQDVENSLQAAVSAWVSAQLDPDGESARRWPLYVVVEKILSHGETLREDWAAYGTTGYDFLNAANGLFVDSASRRIFDKIYRHFIGHEINFHNLANSTKKMVMLVSLASEIGDLSYLLERIAERSRWYRDFTLSTLTFAIREIIACLAVYRTYITGPESVTPQDKTYIRAAVAEAERRNPRTPEPVFDFVQDALLLRNVEDFRQQDRDKLTEFVMKLQQNTGPVMAKGVEDTAFYVYNRLTSLNEVGGDPERFGVSVSAFHEENGERLLHWPHSLIATSTHDAKRGEDVRARIDVLSEMPDEWRAALARWRRMNAAKKTMVDDEPAPDPNDEYLLYQTLLGAWPAQPPGAGEFAAFRERIAAYMAKATMEAKVHTSWVNPNEEYDAAVRAFVTRILPDGSNSRFLDHLGAFQRRVAYFGRFNSLSQVLLKLTSPGVPDIYQGNELWNLSLVDPDNRGPVDYERRATFLADLKSQVGSAGGDPEALTRRLLDSADDGRIKLYLTYLALNLRRAHHEVFANGAYLPLEAVGEKREHVCAFARVLEDKAVVVVVPRLVARLTGGVERPPLGKETWQDTWLVLADEQPGSCFHNALTGESASVAERDGTPGLAMADLLSHFPVALLQRTAR